MKPLLIIEEEIVTAALERARKQYPKFETYWERGVTWTLARDPEIGLRVPEINPCRFAWGINPWKTGNIPRIQIVYRYFQDEEKILLERLAIHDS